MKKAIYLSFLSQKFVYILLFSFVSFCLYAQNPFRIDGKVTSSSGKPLQEVAISVAETKQKKYTDKNGYYSIDIDSGFYNITFSYPGYQTIDKTITLNKNTRLDVKLQSVISLDEAIIYESSRTEEFSTPGSSFTLSKEEMRQLPALLGEPDPMKILQFTASVTTNGDGKTGLFIRGGNSDQTRVFFNQAPIYNPSHLLGIFSVFNPDVTDRTILQTSGISPEYGDALSSVLSVYSSPNIPERFRISGSIGLISSRLHADIPVNEKLSFSFSGRRSYINHLLKPTLKVMGIANEDIDNTDYDLEDYNMSMIWTPTVRDRILLYGYLGNDKAKFIFEDYDLSFRTKWGNKAGSMEWQHSFNPLISMTHIFAYSDYRARSSFSMISYDGKINTSIRDFRYKGFMDYQWSRHYLKAGYEFILHKITPNDSHLQIGNTLVNNDISQPFHTTQVSIYVQDEIEWNKLLLQAGIRYNIFGHYGKYTDHISGNEVISYDKNKLVKSYQGIEPRLSARYLLSQQSSLKASLTRHLQYLNMISLSSSTGLPIDYWIPASKHIKPQKGWHSSLGYYQSTSSGLYEFSGEVYYKSMDNQLENNSTLLGMLDGDNPEESVLKGKGWAYGLELTARKNTGKWRGWASYALSWNWRKFDLINDGNKFPAATDRRHDFSVVGIYEPNDRWRFSSSFVYTTGKPLNVPVGIYILNGNFIYEYGDYNSQRMPDYHRMDVSATRTWKYSKNRYSELNISFYNVYFYKNPFLVFFIADTYSNEEMIIPRAKQGSLFPIIPSVSWSFNF